MFEGVVIKRRGGGISETFTVRKISYGVGVERAFPLHSPKIDKIEVARRGKVRRAKLYYLRELRGKAAELKKFVNITDTGEGLETSPFRFCPGKVEPEVHFRVKWYGGTRVNSPGGL